VNDWALVFLGVIAVATLVMAAIQVGAIIYGARAAQRLEQMLGRFETDLKPVLERAKQVSEDAAKMSALATVQVERVDQVFQDLSLRIDETATMIQRAVVTPAREGAALFAAVRATVAALRGVAGGSRRTPPTGVEEDDALFIG
jgi:ActR/RegA family two-component response regulator